MRKTLTTVPARHTVCAAVNRSLDSDDEALHSKALENTHHQLGCPVHIGHDPHLERPPRTALHLFHLHDDAHLRSHGGCSLRLAPNPAGSATTLPVRGLSVAAPHLPDRGMRLRAVDFARSASRVARRPRLGSARRPALCALAEAGAPACARFRIDNEARRALTYIEISLIELFDQHAGNLLDARRNRDISNCREYPSAFGAVKSACIRGTAVERVLEVCV